MVFPNSSLVEVHTQYCSMGDQIFPGILPYKESIQNNFIEIMQGKRLIMSLSISLLYMDKIHVIDE